MVTIGIPTFNRKKLLNDAISCALNQSYKNTKVIVSDNNSTDNTETLEILKNVEYVKQKENIGASNNFKFLLDQCDTKYFCWLQDDDILFNGFIEDAVKYLELYPQATAYTSYLISSINRQNLNYKHTYGPPVKLDWITGEPTLIYSNQIIPLSLFVSFAIPPVILFKTEMLRKCINEILDASCALYAERLGLAALSINGPIIASPKIFGIHYKHNECAAITYVNKGLSQSHKNIAINKISQLWTNTDNKSIIDVFKMLPQAKIIEYSKELQFFPNTNLVQQTKKAFDFILSPKTIL